MQIIILPQHISAACLSKNVIVQSRAFEIAVCWKSSILNKIKDKQQKFFLIISNYIHLRGAINCLRDIFFAKYWSPQWRPYVMLSTDGVGEKVIKITKSPTCSPDVYLLPLEIRPFVDFILGYLKSPPQKNQTFSWRTLTFFVVLRFGHLKSLSSLPELDLLTENLDILCAHQIWLPQIIPHPHLRIRPSHGIYHVHFAEGYRLVFICRVKESFLLCPLYLEL